MGGSNKETDHQGGENMEMSKEISRRIYKECEKRWNETHRTAWINGNMSERIKLYQEVENELLSK